MQEKIWLNTVQEAHTVQKLSTILSRRKRCNKKWQMLNISHVSQQATANHSRIVLTQECKAQTTLLAPWKAKLSKGSQTKRSTCSMNFWALAWELDHVAYRTIIRKGVSRLIIKELRAYQALSCRCITCHKRCQEKFRIVVKKSCQNSCPNTFNNKICVHDKHVWQLSFLDTTWCFEEPLHADRSAFRI